MAGGRLARRRAPDRARRPGPAARPPTRGFRRDRRPRDPGGDEQPAIELRHVSKTFGEGDGAVHAVDDVSLSIRRGEIFGVIGYSGAGKSTLVRLVNALETVTSGEVVVDGQVITGLSERRVRGCARGSGWCSSSSTSCRRAPSPGTWPTRSRWRAGRARSARRASPSSSRSWGSPTRRRPTRASSRAGRSSASGSPARSRRSPRSSSPTRRPPRSTPRRRARSSRSCGASTPSSASPSSSSRTRWRSCARPATASP